MKNRIFYYLLIVLPIATLILSVGKLGSVWFSALLLVYALIYRPIVDSSRLKSLGQLSGNESWKLWLPFWRLRYFKSLYL